MPRPTLIRPTAVTLGTAMALVAVVAAAAPAVAQPSAHRTHTLHIDGVSLRVPSSWHVVRNKYLPGCIVDPHAAKPSQAARNLSVNDCQLQVLAGRSLPEAYSVPGSIDLNSAGDPAECLPTKHAKKAVSFSTVRASDARVGGVRADYVRLASPCLKHKLEAWFVARQPGVLISRTRMLPSTEAGARRAVASATVPTGHGLPRGFTGEPIGAGSTSVALNPTRLFYTGRGNASAKPTGADAMRFHIPAGRKVLYTDRSGDGRYLTRARFLHDVEHGFPRSGGLRPEVTITSAAGSHTVGRVQVGLASRR